VQVNADQNNVWRSSTTALLNNNKYNKNKKHDAMQIDIKLKVK